MASSGHAVTARAEAGLRHFGSVVNSWACQARPDLPLSLRMIASSPSRSRNAIAAGDRTDIPPIFRSAHWSPARWNVTDCGL
jgi:hypothetical protein